MWFLIIHNKTSIQNGKRQKKQTHDKKISNTWDLHHFASTCLRAMGAHDRLLVPENSEKLLSHRIGDGKGTIIGFDSLKPSISWWTYLKGAIAHCLVWGGLQLGALSPVITFFLYNFLGPRSSVLFILCALFSVLAPSRHSPAFCRFYLGSAACVGGSTVWVPEKILELLQRRGYLSGTQRDLFFQTSGYFFIMFVFLYWLCPFVLELTVLLSQHSCLQTGVNKKYAANHVRIFLLILFAFNPLWIHLNPIFCNLMMSFPTSQGVFPSSRHSAFGIQLQWAPRLIHSTTVEPAEETLCICSICLVWQFVSQPSIFNYLIENCLFIINFHRLRLFETWKTPRALRVKAEAPEQFLPESFNFPKETPYHKLDVKVFPMTLVSIWRCYSCPVARLPDPWSFDGQDCNGVQAPVLWRVPFFAPVLRMWDACKAEWQGEAFFGRKTRLKPISTTKGNIHVTNAYYS